MQIKYLNRMVNNGRGRLTIHQLDAIGNAGIFGEFNDLLLSIAKTASNLTEEDLEYEEHGESNDDKCTLFEFFDELQTLTPNEYKEHMLLR